MPIDQMKEMLRHLRRSVLLRDADKLTDAEDGQQQIGELLGVRQPGQRLSSPRLAEVRPWPTGRCRDWRTAPRRRRSAAGFHRGVDFIAPSWHLSAFGGPPTP
jgi:hypothetical protein